MTIPHLLVLLTCCLPLKHLRLNSAYGHRIHPVTRHPQFHSGIDLQAHSDTVYAIFGGHVQVGYHRILGVYLHVRDGALISTYGHLSGLFLTSGHVRAGEAIAITGATGRVTGAHLHLSISYHGRQLDPLVFLYQTCIKNQHHEH